MRNDFLLPEIQSLNGILKCLKQACLEGKACHCMHLAFVKKPYPCYYVYNHSREKSSHDQWNICMSSCDVKMQSHLKLAHLLL